MLEAFLAIEPRKGKTRRLNLLPAGAEALSAKAAEDARLSVRLQRRLTGATGIPERLTNAVRKALEQRLVPDPMMTDSEFLYQKRREHERAERFDRKPNLDVGKVMAEENAITRIGGLCYIKSAKLPNGKREQHHERAAEWVKSTYEAVLGSQPAMDAGRIQVDTSPIAHDSGMAARVDRGRKLHDLFEHLGKEATNRIVAVVVLERPCGEIADGAGWRARERVVDALLADLDKAAVYLQIRSRAAA